MHRVEWSSIGAWNEFQALDDDDPRKAELRDISTRLVESGIPPPGYTTRSTIIRLWQRDYPGYETDLSDGSGYVGYLELLDDETGEMVVKIAHVIWYP